MYPLVALALGIWLAMLMDGVASQNRDLSQLYQSRLRNTQVVALAEQIEQFYVEKAAFPTGIDTLVGTAGFEHARSLVATWQGYAVSPTLTDGVWQYSRSVLYSVDPTWGTTPAAYLAANACGSGGYDTAASWCGRRDSHWFRRETRERYNEQMVTQRARMSRLLQKLAEYFNKNGKFPDRDQLDVALAANSINRVATLAGFAGAAGACSGTYTYMQVPVDCGDMFDSWGGAIGYQFLSAKHVLLVAETPVFNSAGDRVVVAAEYDMSLL